MRIQKLLVITPTPRWWRDEMLLPVGVSQEKFSGRRLKLENFPYTSREDAMQLQNVSRWICSEVEETDQNTFGSLLATVEGLQVVWPFEWAGHAFAIDKDHFNLRHTAHYAAASHIPWAKVADFSTIQHTRPAACIEAYFTARTNSVIRLINPPLLLMQGMQARNPMISLLLWTMGLDAIVSTSDATKFRMRLSKLLGEKTRFMPRSEFFGEPEYEVGQTAEDIYTLRGILAHGNEIPVQFRDHVGFKVTGASAPPGWETWSYAHVLCQCALHLLCSAIQRIYEDRRLQILAAGEPSTWKNWLDK